MDGDLAAKVRREQTLSLVKYGIAGVEGINRQV